MMLLKFKGLCNKLGKMKMCFYLSSISFLFESKYEIFAEIL